MQRHLVIGAVQVGFVAAGAVHTRAQVVRNDQSRRAQAVLKSRHVAFHPVAQILAQRSARKGVRAGAQNGDKQRGRQDLTGALVMKRNGVTGPVHEHLFAGAVLLAQHHILVAAPAIIQLAETAVTIAIGLGFAILFPDQLQGEMFMRLQLPAHFAKIRQGPRHSGGTPHICRE